MLFILDTEKQIEITETSDVLIVTLKRFRYSKSQATEKIVTLVNIPITDFVPYPTAAKYDLFCVVNHLGEKSSSANSGHYTAYVKSLDKDRWYDTNDRSVKEISKTYIITKDAYVLFYKRHRDK
jgi:ubiquitin C-terminal hydrolase